MALSIWRAALPVVGTPVETYLQARGIGIALPRTIRFHAGLKHPLGGIWPAIVALVSGMRTLELPPEVRDVVVLADGDDPGEAAARNAAHRWLAEGRCVRIALPPFGFDFNDVLTGRTKVQHVAT